MERSRVMKSINANLSHQQSMFDIREPSPPFISSQQKTIAIRDASFSYFRQPQQQPHNQVDDTEISIFDAQKYFNESSSNDAQVSRRLSPAKVINLESIPRFSSASSSVDRYDRNYRAGSFHATPTASSEASWNSRTGLLSNPPGAIAVSIRNPPSGSEKQKGSATKWFMGRTCPCTGKKSVQVEEKLSESRTPSSHQGQKCEDRWTLDRQTPSCVEKRCIATDWLERPELIPNSRRISADNNNHFPSSIAHHRVLASSVRAFSNDGFSFPVLNKTPLLSSSSPIKQTLNPPQEDPPRDSLEVFRPSEDVVPSKITTELHRRQSFTITDDEVASDASSDLFEIESFSTMTTYQMYNAHHRRDSMDETNRSNINNNGRRLDCRQSLDESIMITSSIVAQTECYEPSEASIDWSVTTAEAFERASVTNFSVTASEADQSDLAEKTISGGFSGGGTRKGGGGLLSCRCEKAVSVGPKPVKCVGTQRQTGGNSTMVRHMSSRPPGANRPPLARSHSARLSIPLAT